MASLLPFNGTLDKRLAGHLLRRATFGPGKKDIDQFTGLTPAQAVAQLLQEQELPTPPINPLSGEPLINPEEGIYKMTSDGDAVDIESNFIYWWMAQMNNSGNNITEKMVYFLHTHFTTIKSRIEEPTALYYQIALFRHYALGDFKTLCLKMCKDNAMLRHLDGIQNVKDNPQENFGRELLELYSIGKGDQIASEEVDGESYANYTTYTEQDVKAATKVLSGWDEDTTFETIDPDTGLSTGKLKASAQLMTTQHDVSTKTFSSAFQNKQISPTLVENNSTTVEDAEAELAEMIDMIFEQEAAAKYVCRKLYRFFVYYEITDEIEQDIITPLAQTLIANDYVLKPVLEELLTSSHFYDSDDSETSNNIVGAVIKSPIELVTGVSRFFNMAMPDPETEAADLEATYAPIYEEMIYQGLELYEPFEVAGYSAYHQAPVYNRNWISANYLAYRYVYSEYILDQENEDGESKTFGWLDVIEFVENTQNISNPADAEQLVTDLVTYMFPEEITDERFDYFLNTVLLDGLTSVMWELEWSTYQSSGDDTAVRTQIEALITAIIQSPEFQLM
ncbi:DUF1800 domain-containing protein [Chondrinema litorale]|uniref:DUF1800 domain-containing protein n=1 Tax=Chondrinema litorale TaxID=2994555 RepID=UPI002543894C|nr:DUF1800 family protein [Chondrinema litorale]UZR95087.1 DUF1800 family protein [Chondrinema litorale]